MLPENIKNSLSLLTAQKHIFYLVKRCILSLDGNEMKMIDLLHN
jgi:hypothetical protein